MQVPCEVREKLAKIGPPEPPPRSVADSVLSARGSTTHANGVLRSFGREKLEWAIVGLGSLAARLLGPLILRLPRLGAPGRHQAKNRRPTALN